MQKCPKHMGQLFLGTRTRTACSTPKVYSCKPHLISWLSRRIDIIAQPHEPQSICQNPGTDCTSHFFRAPSNFVVVAELVEPSVDHVFRHSIKRQSSIGIDNLLCDRISIGAYTILSITNHNRLPRLALPRPMLSWPCPGAAGQS